MRSPIAANLRKCFRELRASEVSFDHDFESFCSENQIIANRFVAQGTITALPIFCGSKSALLCAQKRWFGWYAVRTAVRGVMLPVNFLLAADRLLACRLFAPSAAASYTAAYHTLQTFLALRGRVICDPFQWVGPATQAAPTAVAGVLTKNNHWQFEPRVRSHRARWLEVRDALAPGEVPDAFEFLFANLFRNRLRRGTTLQEYFRDPEGTCAHIDECWEDLLLSVSEIRHQALYSSFGEDPNIVEALWNGDLHSEAGIDRQATTLINFAALLLHDSASQLAQLLRTLVMPVDLQDWLSAMVRIPWFDVPRTSELPFDAIISNLDFIEKWVEPNRIRR